MCFLVSFSLLLTCAVVHIIDITITWHVCYRRASFDCLYINKIESSKRSILLLRQNETGELSLTYCISNATVGIISPDPIQ